MKKIFIISFIILVIFSCKKEEKVESDDVNKALINAVTSSQEAKTEDIIPQAKATFGEEKLDLTGKITEQKDNAYINLKAKDSDGNTNYEVVLDYNGKIAVGKYQSEENFAYGVQDNLHKFKLPQGGIVPTTYKQKNGEFEITKVGNNLVDGNFSVEVYDMNKPEIVKTITGTFQKLPIKKVGEN
jgi:hypothetical protein